MTHKLITANKDATSHALANMWEEIFCIMRILRAPDGCPWDQEQTALSIMTHIIEESYELYEALLNNDINHITEELGDVMLTHSFLLALLHENYAIAQNTLYGVREKLIRRHPHIFNTHNSPPTNSEAVMELWQNSKKREQHNKNILPEHIAIKHGPPINSAVSIQKQAAQQGFDWNTTAEVYDVIFAEITELQNAITQQASHTEIEEELGDILFSIINLARHIHCDPAQALLRSNAKFIQRFNAMTTIIATNNETLPELMQHNTEKVDFYWQTAKTQTIINNT